MQQADFCCSSPLVSDIYPLRPFSSFRGCSLWNRKEGTEFSAHPIIKSCPSPNFLVTVYGSWHILFHESTYSK